MKKRPTIKKYPFGGIINKGVTGIASALGANERDAQMIGSGVATATGFIPGMQDNFLQAGDLLNDASQYSNSEDLQRTGKIAGIGSQIAAPFFAHGGTFDIQRKMYPNGGMHDGAPNKYIPGSQHDLSHEEIQYLIKNGYEIEYL